VIPSELARPRRPPLRPLARRAALAGLAAALSAPLGCAPSGPTAPEFDVSKYADLSAASPAEGKATGVRRGEGPGVEGASVEREP
jgi:hypothetical protein